MQILLTGATGFIGRSLARALLDRGWALTALVRNPAAPAALALQQAGARLAGGDVVTSGRDTLRAALRGADVVFHNAGWYELGLAAARRPAMQAANVQGTETILGLAVELGVPKIVYTSTATAYGDTGGVLADESFVRQAPPRSWYERTKTDAHAIARRYQEQGAPLIIVCPAQVIGPGDHSVFGDFARLYARGLLPPAAWAPEGVFTMAHVDDVAAAMALAVERGQPGVTYLLGGTPLTMRELIETWKQTPGGFKPVIWLPRPLAWLTGLLAEPVLHLFGRQAFLSREAINSSYARLRFSSARAERELGACFRPARQAWRETLAAERAAARR
ncbi:MAG: NAD-dependent epimerase/dehydratase family protein [Anaerolineales bacterium]|nr:NAD-dependent epimerase/dehydratase family protein [Anaerolineales bacterium]